MTDGSMGVGYAHSANAAGALHGLADHSLAAARLAREFGSACGLAHASALAALVHDLGKAAEPFQRKLTGALTDRVPHKMAGAVWATDHQLRSVAAAVAGHHGGLYDEGELVNELARAATAGWVRQSFERGVALLSGTEGDVLGASTELEAYRSDPCGEDLATRLTLSCVADGDFLDTEAHFDGSRAASRGRLSVGVDSIAAAFQEHRRLAIADRVDDPVAELRGALFRAVVAQAGQARHLAMLTAPTGAGKTITSLGYALAHAKCHGLRRIVVAAPFTSIVEQTAEVVRRALGELGGAVLEHHSNASGSDADSLVVRLASENWDAEVIVTTTVQLLDSLFSNRPSRVRKLHRLARSVIVVDEAQAIPWTLLDPAIAMLASLVDHVGASVLLCTATQPPVKRLPSMGNAPVPVVELAPDPTGLFQQFRRVEVQDRSRPQMTVEALAELSLELAGAHGDQCLVVVNTVRDAAALAGQLLGSDGVFHLSARMCPAHRRVVLAEVRRRLSQNEPCLLVSTQVVEAGVDVSFPVGVRVVGPAPSIAQVAGRINRHGFSGEHGKLVVVDVEGFGSPPGDYRSGIDISRSLLADGIDLLSVEGTERYYKKLLVNRPITDHHGIKADRRLRKFATVAENFHSIEGDTVGVLCPYGEWEGVLARVQGLPPRVALRGLQPFLVSLREQVFVRAKASGSIVEVELRGPGGSKPLRVAQWASTYDDALGLQTEGADVAW